MTNQHPLAAGYYEMELRNKTNQVQRVWSVALLDYRLAPYNVRSTQKLPAGSSFIYTFYDHQRGVHL